MESPSSLKQNVESEDVSGQPVLLFDGVCNLCASAVSFIIKRDPRAVFRFASLQSTFGQKQLLEHQIPAGTDSVVLIEKGQAYTESTAALRICRHLSGAWPLLYGLIILPKPLRDAGYKFIARHRYRWFGKKDSCMLPTPELRGRFVE